MLGTPGCLLCRGFLATIKMVTNERRSKIAQANGDYTLIRISDADCVGGWGRTEANSYVKEKDKSKSPRFCTANFVHFQVYLGYLLYWRWT